MKRIVYVTFLLLLTVAQNASSAQENRMYKTGFYSDVSVSTGVSFGAMTRWEATATGREVDGVTDVPVSVMLSGGWCFGNGLYAGIGTGVSWNIALDFESMADLLWPLYAEVRYTFADRKVSPFVGLSVGLCSIDGFKYMKFPGPYLAFTAGVSLSHRWSVFGKVSYGKCYYERPLVHKEGFLLPVTVGASYAF